MKKSKLKNAFILALLVGIGFLMTCEYSKPESSENTVLQDTIFLSQWRKEKNEKLERIVEFEKKVAKLQISNDSMRTVVGNSKVALFRQRMKANELQEQLRDVVFRANPTDSVASDSINTFLDLLLVAQEESNSACDTTIHALEQIVANRDSSLLYSTKIQVNLRDITKDQELRNQILTEQLNHALKIQRKKIRQNKMLAGGILILSSITTSVLLINSTK